MEPCGAVPKPSTWALALAGSATATPMATQRATIFLIMGDSSSLLIVDRDFHQVEVRVAHVHRADRPPGPDLGHRSLDDPDVEYLQARDDVLQGDRGDEAQVERSRRRHVRARRELPAPFVHVDLLR